MTYEDEDGNVRLLLGYKFDPTDEVLVNFYLKRKAFDQLLPFQIIPDFDVFQTDPWCLPGGGKIFNERKCFFINTMDRDLENLDMRVVGGGQWRVMDKDKDIPIPRNNQEGRSSGRGRAQARSDAEALEKKLRSDVVVDAVFERGRGFFLAKAQVQRLHSQLDLSPMGVFKKVTSAGLIGPEDPPGFVAEHFLNDEDIEQDKTVNST
ncbi:NAC domain-containing protein 54-like [Lotus japonicus]|uniref:NAC domain-containing protein 54-like n=1 Tax=Lotus japonicus TaxID=34305 RepID=UPI00258E9B4D|nr:NAC domain-containing protein 54-like [Lotus japonicus]